MKIRKGDEVIVLVGENMTKRGVVLRVLRDSNKVVVENVNMSKRHTKGDPQQGTAGGILEKEMPINASNVAIWNPVSNKADGVGYKRLEDGRMVRYFKSNDEVIDI